MSYYAIFILAYPFYSKMEDLDGKKEKRKEKEANAVMAMTDPCIITQVVELLRFENIFTQFQVNMKGLDGIQGPVYVGTGCVFNRQALYGYGPASLPSLPKASSSSSSCSWCGCCSCCCPSKKTSKDPSEVYRDAKREELDAAIFNLREIDSKSTYQGNCILWK